MIPVYYQIRLGWQFHRIVFPIKLQTFPDSTSYDFRFSENGTILFSSYVFNLFPIDSVLVERPVVINLSVTIVAPLVLNP